MIDTQQLLCEGIAAAKAGKRDVARQVLMQIIEIDERNEQAWLWLAGVVDDPADQRVCLENVLDLNPDNPQAKRGLAWLEQHHPTPAAPTDRAPAVPAPDPPPIPAPFSAPTRPPVTGATHQVHDDGATPLATRPQEQGSSPLTAAPETDQYPCPYCGAPTLARHHTCPSCHRSLMVRGTPREKRSIATTIVGFLWIISGIPSMLGGLFLIGAGLYESSQFQSGADSVFLGILMLVGGGFVIQMGRAYLRCKPWAYIFNAILLGLSLIVGLLSISTIICSIVILGGHLALTILGYRDFYGPRMRILPEVEAQDDVGLYNMGVAFKNRGMWYMAMKTWETAARLSPRQANYHHALGLAYAQLHQFEQAISTLQEAIKLDPNDLRIQESLKLVQEKAAQAQKGKRRG